MNAPPETLREKFGTPSSDHHYQGTSIYRLDVKGRLVIPSEIEDDLGVPFILIPALELDKRRPFWTLLAISIDEWRTVIQENRQCIEWWRLCGSMALPVRPDETTGRILIPNTLRLCCEMRLKEEMIVRRMGSAVQIMRKADWDLESGRGMTADAFQPFHQTTNFADSNKYSRATRNTR